MTENSSPSSNKEEILQGAAVEFATDPLGHALFAYPWKQKGTTLERWDGPDEWQAQIMTDIQHALEHGWVMNNGIRKEQDTVIRIAVASGHGIGKSALLAMIRLWFSDVMPYSRGVTTAVKETQLRTKTWKELAKWHKMSVFKDWHKWTSTQLQRVSDPDEWFHVAEPWSEHNTDAFQGLHGDHVMVHYDEASGIVNLVWEVTEGAFTDSGGVRIWLVFGNPTTTAGRFYQCFTKEKHLWLTYNVDSRSARRTDTKYLNQLVSVHGEDSDYVRVRIRGMFPKGGDLNLISASLIDEAMRRMINLDTYKRMPKILGVDVAGAGDDMSAMIIRQGFAAYDLRKFTKLDDVEMAGQVVGMIKEHNPDRVFIDNGYGHGVVSILKNWGWGHIVQGVWFQSTADEKDLYLNKRAEMWYNMRDWLKDGGCVEKDEDLMAGVAAPYRIFNETQQKHALEPKKEVKKREEQLDCADALALTFAYPVEVRSDHGCNRHNEAPVGAGYNPTKYGPNSAPASSYNPTKY